MNENRVVPGRLSLLIVVFATALSVLAFEVGLSRAFSVLLRYHFVFLAISLAGCGMGLGGLLDYLTDRWYRRSLTPVQHLVLRAGVLAVLYPLSIGLLFATPLSALLTSVWVVSGICVLPFLVAGTLLSRVFAEHSAAGGELYFADLLGAALGSFLVIGALQLGGATNVPFLCGLMAAAGGLAVAVASRQWRLQAVAGAVMVLLVGALLANLQWRVVDLPLMPLRADEAAKPLYQELGDPREGAQIMASEWNAFARTDVVTYTRPGSSADPRGDYYIYTDGEVPTNMLWFAGDLKEVRERLQSFIGYAAFHWFRPDEVLLIGPGGGLDILLANAVGARTIHGVELNPSIPRIVRQYGEFNGHVYDQQGVTIWVDEGRSFVRRAQTRYDLIYMALTKTATTASSSLALVEGYIYTREAFVDYLQRLTPQGKVALVLQESALTLRTYLTALEALQDSGMSRSEALGSLMICSVPEAYYSQGPYRYLLVMSRQPFSPAESTRLAKECIGMGLVPGYFPGAFEPVPFSWLTQQQVSTPEFVSYWNQWQYGTSEGLNIAPCTDDRPFVVDLTYQVPRQFRLLLGGTLLGALIFSVIAVQLQARRRGREAVRGLPAAVVYFALLGAGFMMVEVCLAQRLVLYLGYPVLTLSVILFSLLLGGGLGSLLSQRWPATVAARVGGLAALAVVIYGMGLHFGQQPLLAATLGWDIRLRCLVTMLLLLPLGLVLGMPFPTGLRAVGARAAQFVPWMWGINGLTSVVGSVGAMIMAKLWGFSHALLLGLGLYALVAVLCLSGMALQPVREDDAAASDASASLNDDQ